MYQNNFNHPNHHQIDHHFVVSDEQLRFSSTPCNFLPYVESTVQFPHRDHTFLQVNDYPFTYNYPSVCSSFPMGLSNYSVNRYRMQTWESSIVQRDRKKKEAMMSKIARDIRKQARQRARSSSTCRVSSSILEQASVEDINVHKDEIRSIIPNTLHSLDGKRLTKLFTKKLKNSDVNFIGRIVLPKKEAEKNLPALSNKEGIKVVLKDVCTNQQWSMRYKYWCNNKSRMYVLENTGNFVRHYQLQIGDSITLFEDDELKNLYVLPKKEQTLEVPHQLLLPNKEEEKNVNSNNNNFIDMPYLQVNDYEDETCFGKLIDELFNQKGQESSQKLSNIYNNIVGGSSSKTEEILYSNINASQEVSPNGACEGKLGQVDPTPSFQDEDLEDFFEGLDMSQFGSNLISS